MHVSQQVGSLYWFYVNLQTVFGSCGTSDGWWLLDASETLTTRVLGLAASSLQTTQFSAAVSQKACVAEVVWLLW